MYAPHDQVIYTMSLARLNVEMSSGWRCRRCNESILMAEETTQFIIKPCPRRCFRCSDTVMFLRVFWHDGQGNHGEAIRNRDENYTVYQILWTMYTHYPMACALKDTMILRIYMYTPKGALHSLPYHTIIHRPLMIPYRYMYLL